MTRLVSNLLFLVPVIVDGRGGFEYRVRPQVMALNIFQLNQLGAAFYATAL